MVNGPKPVARLEAVGPLDYALSNLTSSPLAARNNRRKPTYVLGELNSFLCPSGLTCFRTSRAARLQYDSAWLLSTDIAILNA